MSRFTYTHEAHGHGSTIVSVTFNFWWDWCKVTISVPAWVEVTFDTWSTALRWRDHLRQCDSVDQVGLAGEWMTLSFRAKTLDGCAQALGIKGIKQDVIDGVQNFVVRRHLTTAQTLLHMRSLIPTMPSDQEQDVSLWSHATTDHVVVRVIQDGIIRHLSSENLIGVNHVVDAVRWDKLDPVLDMLSAPLIIEEA